MPDISIYICRFRLSDEAEAVARGCTSVTIQAIAHDEAGAESFARRKLEPELKVGALMGCWRVGEQK